jgi:hypothetical protein
MWIFWWTGGTGTGFSMHVSVFLWESFCFNLFVTPSFMACHYYLIFCSYMLQFYSDHCCMTHYILSMPLLEQFKLLTETKVPNFGIRPNVYVILTELTAAVTLPVPLQNTTWVTLKCGIPRSGIKARVLSLAVKMLYEWHHPPPSVCRVVVMNVKMYVTKCVSCMAVLSTTAVMGCSIRFRFSLW